MLKKILSLCCAAIIALGAASASYAAETEADPAVQITPQQELLIALDLISLNSYGEIDSESEVTRAEFADICGKLLGINPTASETKAYFNDVMPDKWYAHTVNMLAQMGVISQPENKLFEPERAITCHEAIKMLVCLMGYGDYAESTGGYPGGYISAAMANNLLDNVGDIGGTLTEGAMSNLVYNALHANVMKVDYAGSEPQLSIDKNETLMSYCMNIYEDRGTVETVFGMSLTDKTVPEDRVIIDGAEYYTGDVEGVTDLLGSEIRFYYREDDYDIRTLVYVEDTGTSRLTIRSDDIEEFGGLGGVITYYDGERSKTAKIASDASVIRNGETISTGVDEAFNIVNGELTLIDGDKNGTYETAVIYDYETVVVNSFDIEKGVIGDAIDRRLMIDISECTYVSVYSETGDKLDISSITIGSVVDVAYSADHAFIYVNSGNFEGTIEGVDYGSEEIIVNGTRYEYLPKAYDRYMMRSGYTGVFKTNHYGQVSYFELTGSNTFPGYVIKASYTDELQETCMLKMLTAAGEVEWIETDTDFVKDGEHVSGLDSLIQLQDKVVLYNVNSEGVIVSIDSPARTANEEDTTLTTTLPVKDGGYRWTSSTRMFGKNVICSPDMIIFKVPPATSTFRDDDSYSVVTSSSLVSNKMCNVAAYSYGGTSYSNVLVLYETKYVNRTSDPLILVTQVNEGVNEQLDEVYYIKGYQNGSPITIEANRPRDVIPKPGDCIRVARDTSGKAGLIEIHYDIERDGSGWCDTEAYWYWPPVNGEPYDAINNYWNGTFTDLQADYRMGFGYPVMTDGEILKWSFDKDGDAVDELTIIDSGVPIIVYDADDDMFCEGSLSDIKTKEIYGGDCSTIIVNFHWGEPTELFVINDRNLVYGD